MAELIIMPKLGFNMDEGKLLKWYVKEGEEVVKGKPLFSIETDKTSIDIDATVNGFMRKMLLSEGEKTRVTSPIAIVAGLDENIDEALADALAKLGKPAQATEKTAAQPDAKGGQAGVKTAQPDEKAASAHMKTEQAAARDFDIAVIGGGPGGYVAAIKAAQMGKKTVLVEKGALGGVCLNRGCVPTKVLLKSAAVLRDVNASKDYGVKGISGNAVLDMDAVQQRKTKIVSQLVQGVGSLLKANGVSVLAGSGELVDAHTINVDGKPTTADYIIIATGSSVKPFPVAGGSAMKVMTSDEALELTEIPDSIVIVGGGVIGVEFACFFASSGSKVTVVEFMDKILPMADEEISDQAAKMLKDMGVSVFAGAKVSGISKGTVEFEKDGKKESINTSCILVSVGRAPNLNGIDCEALGIKTEGGAIVTDSSMRTSAESIFAIGDVNGKAPLAHTASAEAIVAVETICGHNSAMSYDAIPNVVFAHPEIAWVGLTEAQAKAKHGKVKIGKFPMLANGKSKIDGEERGFIKVVITEKYHEIVGVHLFCLHASDMIAEASLAMNLEATAEEMLKSVHPHPTVSEVYSEAFHSALGSAIHFMG